jgi:hypothetical protein
MRSSPDDGERGRILLGDPGAHLKAQYRNERPGKEIRDASVGSGHGVPVGKGYEVGNAASNAPPRTQETDRYAMPEAGPAAHQIAHLQQSRCDRKRTSRQRRGTPIRFVLTIG